MTKPTTAGFVACSRCRKFYPVETLHARRGGHKRLMRYCPACWAMRAEALAALGKGNPG